MDLNDLRTLVTAFSFVLSAKVPSITVTPPNKSGCQLVVSGASGLRTASTF